MSPALDGKVAIITGAGRGIGQAIAKDLSQNGAKVIVNDIGVELDGSGSSNIPALQTINEIRKNGGVAELVLESVSDWAGGQKTVQSAIDHFGRLDIVVTAAGILKDRMIYNMSEEEWDEVIAVHLKGTASICRYASVIFREQRAGRIITFSSESGLIGFSGQANYGAAKSGIAGFTKVIAKDLGKYNVTANSIAPRADTRMVKSIPENVKVQLRKQGLLPQKGESPWTPEDIAPFVTYLASDYAAPINGQVFLVYGGTVTHLSPPRRIKTIYKENPPGYWDFNELNHNIKRFLFPQIPQVSDVVKKQNLKNKVAIVTGGGRGIGRGIAKKLAKEGASVVIVDTGVSVDGQIEDKGPAESVVEEISEFGGQAIACHEDVTTVMGGQNIIQLALNTFGKLDILITAAGILRDRMIFNMTEREWDDVIDVHLKGTFSTVKPASNIFRQQQSGRIITFSSVSGLYGYGGQANYGAAKDAIAGFTRVVAKDLAKYGVTVNSISPSAHTRMTNSVPDSTRSMRKTEFPNAPEGTLVDDPEHLAPLVAWLASDQSFDITGTIFHIGGNHIGIMSHPLPNRSIHKEGRWTVKELAAILPDTIGMDMVNPAPPQ